MSKSKAVSLVTGHSCHLIPIILCVIAAFHFNSKNWYLERIGRMTRVLCVHYAYSDFQFFMYFYVKMGNIPVSR